MDWSLYTGTAGNNQRVASLVDVNYVITKNMYPRADAGKNILNILVNKIIME